MHPKLQLKIYEAIEKVIEDNSEDISGLVEPNLVKKMTAAAELVFDTSMEAQEFAENEQSGFR